MTEPTADSLHAVLLPQRGEPLLLPQLALADAVAPGALRAAADGAPDWFAGWIAWQDLELPVLRFEPLNGGSAASGSRRARIAVLQPLGAAAGEPRFGLLCDGPPQLTRIAREALTALPLQPSDVPAVVLARVRLDGRDVLVPDLAALEARTGALPEPGLPLGPALEPPATDPSVAGVGD